MVAVRVSEPHALAVVASPPVSAGPGEVLVAVRRAGICGSDLHILHGSNPFARYPRILGHEFMGEIEAVGAGVTGLAARQRVVVTRWSPAARVARAGSDGPMSAPGSR